MYIFHGLSDLRHILINYKRLVLFFSNYVFSQPSRQRLGDAPREDKSKEVEGQSGKSFIIAALHIYRVQLLMPDLYIIISNRSRYIIQNINNMLASSTIDSMQARIMMTQ